MRVVLATTAERNKKLQLSACTLLCEVIEAGDTCLFPYVIAVSRAVAAAFEHYQLRSSNMLYDVLGTMARYFGSAMQQQEVLSIIVPPLMAHLERFNSPDDPCAVPLLDCFVALVRAAGPKLNSIAGTLAG